MKLDAPKSDVVSHPYRDLLAEAQHEREVADCPEAQALQIAICKPRLLRIGLSRRSRRDLAKRP